MKNKFRITRKAYSLIELSIVLVIISILITGAMSVSVESLKNNQINSTREKMSVIYKRLGNHIRWSMRLPCPASLTKIKSADSDYGTAGDCSNVSGVYSSGNFVWGMVPAASLGISSDFAEDSFGSKILYFVDKRFTVASEVSMDPDFSIAGTTGSFSITGNNQLSSAPATLWTIKESPASSGVNQDVTQNAVFGLVSFGPNKLGAYNASSSTVNSAAIADADEAVNASAATFFVSSSPGSNSFDDVVFYKTFKDIISDNPDLNNFVPCRNTEIPGYSSTWYDSGNKSNAWYEGVIYSKKRTDCAANPNLRYSFKCGPGGKWTTLVNSCSVSGVGCASFVAGNYGVGAYYDGSQGTSFSVGTRVTLSCRTSGLTIYGREIIGGTNTSSDPSQTCGRTTTDRGNTPPTATCGADGNMYISNDCSLCRSCNSSSENYSAKKNEWCYRGCGSTNDQCFVIQSQERNGCGNTGDKVFQVDVDPCAHGRDCTKTVSGLSCGTAQLFYRCTDNVYSYSGSSYFICY